MDQQAQNNPIMYPSRVYNGNEFIPNSGREQSSDNLTTVMTDSNEVLGFEDGTSQQEMEHAINADRNGSISEYKPSFYDKFIREPLKNLGIDAFQPKFISDITPTPERAFATSMARAATADIFKPSQSEKEAQAYPVESFAGGLVGSIAAFATGGALLDGWKLTELTPFAENIIKGGALGGAYKSVSETSNELRDSDHPDLAKIGTAVLHDSLWWGAIGGVVSSVAKPVGVAAAAGLGYLMAKSDGADEPSALLNGGVLAGFHLLSTHGEQPEVRQMVVDTLQKNVGDYILAKNPAIHPIVADRAGVEFIQNHAQDVVEEANKSLNEKQTEEVFNKDEFNAQDKINELNKPITNDPYSPKMLDWLTRYFPSKYVAGMDGELRLALFQSPVREIRMYAEDLNKLIEQGKQKESTNSEIDRLISIAFAGDIGISSEGANVNVLDEIKKSHELTTKLMQNVAKEVIDIKSQGAENGTKEVVSEHTIGQETKGQEQASNDLRDEGGAKSQEEVNVERGTSKIAESINAKAVEDKLTTGFKDLAGYDKVTVKDQAERATKALEDIDNARAIIRGEEPLPEGLKGISLITAMEEHLKTTPNPDLAYELANSPLITATSEAAQELRLAAERTPDSATAKLAEVKKALIESKGGAEKVSKARKAIVKDAKTEIDKINLSKEELSMDKFLKEIEC